MNNSTPKAKSCNCNTTVQNDIVSEKSVEQKLTFKGIPSIILSVFIAFFPKCPVCWAAYMSMFGSIGLAQLPYMGWLLPVLSILLVVYLYMLYKKSDTNGYLPFQLSLVGATLMLLGKVCFPDESWLVFIGMGLIISASLLISFSAIRLEYFVTNKAINNNQG